MISNICVLQGLRLASGATCETNISQVVCYLMARRAASGGGEEAGGWAASSRQLGGGRWLGGRWRAAPRQWGARSGLTSAANENRTRLE